MKLKREDLQLYASIAEIVSAVAIVISLLYVVSEFRQAQALTERDVDVQLFDRVGEANRIVIENPGIAAIIIAAAQDPQGLSEVDRARYLAIQHQFFDSWELAWGYHQDGILGAELWSEWDGWFTVRARSLPAFAWTENRDNFSGEFRDHVDHQLNPEATSETRSR